MNKTDKKVNGPLVSIIMGSDSDLEVVKEAADIFKNFSIPHEVRIISAHRSPDEVVEFAKRAEDRGIKVIIAAAGGAAHLPGVIASHTTLPVIGIPMETEELKGIDSLLSIVQMPAGVPVGTMAIGRSGTKNAALFAVEILALIDNSLICDLIKYKARLVEKVKESDRKVQDSIRKCSTRGS
ncbi:MAG: 5-(carboxyamino)imidazole ribonucleotide mutase [Candidatus Omnitrophica bacterium]|nr:5-(carboxyamino)imidazole ribonucleotide mutase [Candidatus Omnitrophota bacterium]